LKILQICAAYKPAFIYGGPTMSVSMLSEQLIRAGVPVEVFTTTANGKKELSVLTNECVNVDGVPVTYFKRITKDHSHFSPSLLKAVATKAPIFELVHIHAWWNLVSVLSCCIALMRNVPVFISPRGTLSPYSFSNKNIGVKWLIHNLLGKFLLNRCHIHATSQRENEALIKLIHPKSITVLPNFVKLPGLRPIVQNVPSGHLKLLFFSRIEEKKGLHLLLDALLQVSIPYHLTIAGDGNQDYINTLKTTVIKNNLQDKVTWAGFYTENKFELLHSHDLFILPSYDENFGNAVIESLSVGTAVLISEDVGLAGYVQTNRLGWVCQTNSNAFASAINTIANDDREELARISKDAPDLIYDDFNSDKLVRDYINMYDKIVKE
jgi:glycosyltransferase involved in cell wall biosynthesis